MPCAQGGCRDVRPAGVAYFSLRRQRKVPKRKATPSLRPLRFATGKPAAVRLRGAPWNSLCCCAAPLGQPRRVRSRSMGAPTPAPPPLPPRRRRSQQGVNSQTAIRVVAALDPTKLRPAQGACAHDNRAERSNGPSGGLGFAPPLCMRRGAQRPADQGLGDCLSEAQRSEFERDPAATRAPQVARSEAQGRRQWGRLFFAFFSLAKQKKVTCAAGRTPRLPHHAKA